MVKTLEAVWDGQTLLFDEPLEFEPNTRLRVTIESEPSAEEQSLSFFDTALSLNLEGPPDWATNFDDYLYGGKGEAQGDDTSIP